MRKRARIEIHGAVQGVGFRPFVHRLARELRLDGWVANGPRGVVIEVEGPAGPLDLFLERLPREVPAPAEVHGLTATWHDPAGLRGFAIHSSEHDGTPTASILPDLATCADCLGDVFDPANRRHGYPFTNCTHCGPRLTIIRALPYDRANTSMSGFALCRACRAEYEDPADRRFHAQPNACGDCGPQLELWDSRGATVSRGAAALAAAGEQLARGRIVAVKGIGGFHLMVDARDGAAIERLRATKPRREKPFALMARDVEQAAALCRIDAVEAGLLRSPAAPIVLLERRPDAPVHERVAPGNRCLGVMLPATPLHHLLLREIGLPVVATSGNLSDEPICIDEREARTRLAGIADAFLVHDRPIVRQADDSVVRVLAGTPALFRRSRGYAPRPIVVDAELPVLLAVGAQLKNTVALSVGRQIFVSPHVGDMGTPEALEAFERVVGDFLELYAARPVAVAHDLHPGYATTLWARRAVERSGPLAGLPLVGVQHHHAHLASCLVEHGAAGPALGVTWDGTGDGGDGTIWGGEFLVGTARGFERRGSLRSFRLPGGEAAIREPRRSALSLLWELLGPPALERDDLAAVRDFSVAERRVLAAMLARGVNAPVTTSAGRLFDGVAALAGLHLRASFEGQAALALEHAADTSVRDAYPVEVRAVLPGNDVVDWSVTVQAILDDLRRGVGIGAVSARFHNALAQAIVRVATRVGEPRVALTGGCFQNGLLVERARESLRRAGFEVLLQHQVPMGDGGIALGQIAVAAARSLPEIAMAPDRRPVRTDPRAFRQGRGTGCDSSSE